MLGPNLRRSLAFAPLAAALLLSTGCMGSGTALQGAAPVSAGPPPDVEIVIPLGAAEASERGAPIFSMPTEFRLVAGQSITIRNQDQAMHYFFETPIYPGQTFRKTFDRPGRFGYSTVLSCSIGGVDSLTVLVAPSPRER